MKVLVFHIGEERFGLRLAGVSQVLPAAALTALPLTPDYVGGLLDLHGTPVPVIDLARLAGNAPAALRFDTRIVVADYAADGGRPRPLGLLAERLQGVQEVAPCQLHEGAVRGAPFLGQVATGDGALLQLVDIEHLLAPDVRALLFPVAQA
jgi:chemotaxis-related protein WspB